MKLKQLGIGFVMIGGLALSPAARAEKPSQGGPVDGQFQMMDTNADGKISPEEHAAGAKRMFDTMDANKDGKVTAAEMTEAHARVTGQKAEKTEMSAAEKIKVIDTNGDGALTAEEHAAGSKKMFEMMDANHDGFVSKTELMAGHARMMHKAAKPQ
jgi:Ca2+-binding EF-hand superfamily protein